MTIRDVLLSAQPKTVDFDLEIGGKTLKLRARELTGAQSDSVSDYAIDGAGKMNVRAFYNYRLILSIVDAKTGNQTFADEDYDAINSMPRDIIVKLREQVAIANNDINLEEVAKAKKP